MTQASGTATGEPTPLGIPATFDGGLVEVADRTWAWLQPNGGLGESNAGLVVGGGESLLVDTLWDERLTRVLLDAVAPVTVEAGAPITRLLNTHGDGDHWYGNGLLDDAVEIIATERAIEQMREEPPSMLTRLAPLGTVAGITGRIPLLPGAASMRGLATFNAALSQYEFGGISPRVAGSPFTGSLGLEVGGRRVEVTEVGPAHTPGDAIVWVPDTRVVFAGDIFFNGVTPITWAGAVDNWLAALERIELLDPDVVVGGHGPPGGLADIRVLRDYWLAVIEAVADDEDGKPSEIAERLVTSPAYKSAPWGAWSGPERTLVNVARIAATRRGGEAAVGTLERIRLIGAMGSLGERL